MDKFMGEPWEEVRKVELWIQVALIRMAKTQADLVRALRALDEIQQKLKNEPKRDASEKART